MGDIVENLVGHDDDLRLRVDNDLELTKFMSGRAVSELITNGGALLKMLRCWQ